MDTSELHCWDLQTMDAWVSQLKDVKLLKGIRRRCCQVGKGSGGAKGMILELAGSAGVQMR